MCSGMRCQFGWICRREIRPIAQMSDLLGYSSSLPKLWQTRCAKAVSNRTFQLDVLQFLPNERKLTIAPMAAAKGLLMEGIA